MSSKSIIWIGMIAGSTIGGFVPAIWGAGYMSMSSVIFTAIGGFAGIFLGLKLQE